MSIIRRQHICITKLNHQFSVQMGPMSINGRGMFVNHPEKCYVPTQVSLNVTHPKYLYIPTCDRVRQLRHMSVSAT